MRTAAIAQRRRRLMGALFVLVATTLAAAQAPPTPAPAAEVQGAVITVEGCLTREGDATRSTAAEKFLLTDKARPAAAPAASAAATRGATASGTQAPAPTIYVLRTNGKAVDLPRHVNTLVRVTGATTAPMTSSPLAGRSPEATPNPAPTAPAGSTGSVFDTSNLPTLTVTMLVMVGNTCG